MSCNRQVKTIPVQHCEVQTSYFSEQPFHVLLSEEVEKVFRKMTIQEKIGQLNLIRSGASVKTGEVVSENVQQKIQKGLVGGLFGVQGKEQLIKIQKQAMKSRLAIPLIFGLDVIHGYKTTFPIPLALSCSWDMNLIENVARISAQEATSDGVMWTFSPMVDIARDPRWGRIAEGAGEDPFLGSAIAKAMVKGYQSNDISAPNTMAACVKHFANYGAPEGGRDYATVDMSRVRSHNEYLPPYKAAIEAGVSSVMTAFNVMEYVPASANPYLYNDLLRDKWGFDGVVVTDYTAINEMINHGIGDLQEVSTKAINVHVDMDMVGEGFLTTLEKSLKENKVSLEKINLACRRVLKIKEDLGLFEDPFKYFQRNEKKELLSENNRSFARRSATESIVLLKNKNDILPLDRNTKIALIGPLANSQRNMLGCWSVAGEYEDAITLLEGFKNIVNSSNLKYAKGCNITDDQQLAARVNALGQQIIIDDRSVDEMISEALNIASQSEVIIAVMGEAANMTGEASSMADLRLLASQRKLLEALKKLNKPIVLILFNGRPMVLNWEEENIDGILEVWFGGVEAGNAIADVVFGKVNPSGKLTTSFPVSVGQIPVYHSMLNTGRPNNKSQKKFRSNYLDIVNEPLYPFGYGLSYTKFEYGNMQLSDTILNLEDKIIASIEVTNTGNRSGKEIVQLYIRDIVGSISRPLKELKGFVKVELDVGEIKKLRFVVDESMLKFYNSELEYVIEEGKFEIMIGRNSDDIERLIFTFAK